MKKCKNLITKPKNKVARQFLCIDRCVFMKLIKGHHFTYSWKNDEDCPFVPICKHYKEGEE